MQPVLLRSTLERAGHPRCPTPTRLACPLTRLALYLVAMWRTSGDPVARFISPTAPFSNASSVRRAARRRVVSHQSHGVMVNLRYDPDQVGCQPRTFVRRPRGDVAVIAAAKTDRYLAERR